MVFSGVPFHGTPRMVKLKRQWFAPGRRIEQVGRLASNAFFTRERPVNGVHWPSPHDDARPRGKPLLARVAENAGALFSILVSVVLIVAIVATLVALTKELRRQNVVVAPVSVPQDIGARGYDPVAASQLVVNEIQAVEASAQTSHVRRQLVAGSDIPDVHIIGANTSMQSIVRYARSMFGHREARIGGQVLRDPSGLRMVIDLQDERGLRTLQVVRADDDIDALLKDGARAIVQLADPYVLASYLFREEGPGGTFPKTLAAINYVLRNPPVDDDAWALNLWGLVYGAQHDYAKAEEMYRRAQAMPNAPRGIIDNNLAYALAGLGRSAEARALLLAGASRADADFASLQAACTSFYWLGYDDEGIAFCRRAAAIDPKAPMPLFWLALYLQSAGHDDAAARAIEQSRALSAPDEFDWASPTVYTQVAKGDAAGALATADELLGRIPPGDENIAWMHHARALALTRLGRFAEALVDLNAFDAAQTGDPHAYPGIGARGEIYLAQGHASEALALFDKVLAVNPRVAWCVADKARALAALGQRDAANREFALAARLAPDRAETWSLWADMLAAGGNAADAAAKRAEATKATARALG